MKFINLLPLRLKIYAYRINKLDLVAIIDPIGSVVTDRTVSGMVLQVKDEIHATYSPPNSKSEEYEILEPITLVEDVKVIRLGDVTYEERTNTLVQRSHSDITGLRMHSKIAVPVHVYYNGLRLALLNKDDGTGFQAGSPGTVYVNNDTQGFNIGDKLEFRLVFTSFEVPWCTITINDNYMSDLYVGQVTQKYNIAIQDAYSYREGTPNFSGLKYLHGNLAYESIV